MGQVIPGELGIVWLNKKTKEIITKDQDGYSYKDKSNTFYSMGNTPITLKESLEQIGRIDVIRELAQFKIFG